MSLHLSPPLPGPVLPSTLKALQHLPDLPIGNDQLNRPKSVRYKGNCYVCVWGSAEGAGSRDLSVLGGFSSQGAWYYPWLPLCLALRYWPCCITYRHVGFSLQMPKSLTPKTQVFIHQLLWNRCVNRSFTHLLSIGLAPCLFFCSLLLPSVFLEE